MLKNESTKASKYARYKSEYEALCVTTYSSVGPICRCIDFTVFPSIITTARIYTTYFWRIFHLPCVEHNFKEFHLVHFISTLSLALPIRNTTPRSNMHSVQVVAAIALYQCIHSS